MKESLRQNEKVLPQALFYALQVAEPVSPLGDGVYL